MHVESAHRLYQLVIGHQARHLRPGGKHISQARQPLRGKQEGPRPAPSLGSPPDDLVALRDEDSPLTLHPSAKLRVTQ